MAFDPITYFGLPSIPCTDGARRVPIFICVDHDWIPGCFDPDEIGTSAVVPKGEPCGDCGDKKKSKPKRKK